MQKQHLEYVHHETPQPAFPPQEKHQTRRIGGSSHLLLFFFFGSGRDNVHICIDRYHGDVEWRGVWLWRKCHFGGFATQFCSGFLQGILQRSLFLELLWWNEFFFSLLMSCCVFPFFGELVKNSFCSFRGWILLGIPLVTWDEFWTSKCFVTAAIFVDFCRVMLLMEEIWLTSWGW